VDDVFTPEGPRVAADYVLAVATLEPRKNLRRAVEAARAAGVDLRVVGARGWGGVDVEGWVGEVPDSELAALYRGARCLVYPSLYEGFGLPVLEAMACGAPVLTTRILSLPEVGGDAVAYTEPDAGSIGRALAALLADPGQRRSLGLAARSRAAQFDWRACARAHLASYTLAAGS